VAREASAEAPLLVLLALGLAPALGEELLFRGLVLRLLATRLGGPAAVLGSAALFGAAHLDPVHGAAAFFLGAYLGAVAWAGGSVRTPVLCHAANNTLAVLGAQGWVPEPGPPGDPWLAALALGLAAACLALATGLLQRRFPPADRERGPHEDHSSGPPRR
jgi:membrane protease YdiL (CAAX protease family)